MRQVDFKPIGRRVSCLGLGCARLDGRVALRQSAKLIQTAIELGFTYFDVAASYGYGTAEEALGTVLGDSDEAIVATKVGPRPAPYDTRKMRIKYTLKPLLDRAHGFKILLRSLLARHNPSREPRPRYSFSQEAIERSLEGSLRRLRRDHVDVFLAHEPNRLDLTPEVEARFQTLVDRGQVGAFGVGVDIREDQWVPFGSIWQSGWPGDRVGQYLTDITHVYHGVLRYAQEDRVGKSKMPVEEFLRSAQRACPNSVFLVSASTPQRLRQLVRAVEESE